MRKLLDEKKQSVSCSSGFTLIEVLLYISFTTLALLLSGNFLLQILDAKASLNAKAEVYHQAHFALTQIDAKILGASSVSIPLPGESSSNLSLQEGSTTVNYEVVDGVLVESDGISEEELTTDVVEVSALRFTNIAFPGAPDAIQIEITVDSVNPAGLQQVQVSERFHTVRVLRVTP